LPRLGGLPRLLVAAADHPAVGNFGNQLEASVHRPGQQAPERAGIAGHVGAALGGVQVAAVSLAASSMKRLGNFLLAFFDAIGKETFLAMFADVAVRVDVRSAEQNLTVRTSVAKNGAASSAGCATTGVVAVKLNTTDSVKQKRFTHMLGHCGQCQM
jgi:hypothetical protein